MSARYSLCLVFASAFFFAPAARAGDVSGAVRLPATKNSQDQVWNEFKKNLLSLAGRPYVFGGTDCSWLPFTALNATPGLCSRARPGFEQDAECFTRCDGGPYQAGDLILLGRGSPDHWVVLSEVVDLAKPNSPDNKIIDQSSDCRGFCGEGPVRPNLIGRRVFACARPRGLGAEAVAAGASSAPEAAARAPVLQADRREALLDGASAAAASLTR